MLSNSDPFWDEAFKWLCHSRRKFPSSADIWHLRWQWPKKNKALYWRVISGQYRLSPMLVYKQRGTSAAIWSATDALVLKWVSLHVKHLLSQSKNCMHLRGGIHKCTKKVYNALAKNQYRFVYRTDIRGYYGNINKQQVINSVTHFITDPVHSDIIYQYVNYSVEHGGEIATPAKGIPRGCALSPLIGATLLRHIDDYFNALTAENCFYVRYMDDFLLFTRTRWQLRRAISRLVYFFDLGGFERHPDKTQIGKIEGGFDWLGLWFGPDGTTLSPRALANHQERRVRLYEQRIRAGCNHKEAELRVDAYESRWKIWANSLLRNATA